MAKIYEALKAAQQEQDARGEVPKARAPKDSGTPPELRDKLLATYQAIRSAETPGRGYVVAFMGSKPGEGTSTLARAFSRFASAEMGKRVLLLDADYGFGRHAEALGIALTTTCEAAVAEGTPVEHACVAAGETLRVACLVAPGTSLPSFASSPAFHETFARLRASFDLIALDAPPAQESSDALLLVPESDGVTFVVEAEKTRWQVARNACDKIMKQGGTVLGVVLNKRRHYIPQSIYRLL